MNIILVSPNIYCFNPYQTKGIRVVRPSMFIKDDNYIGKPIF